jgi:hypothetical protein
MEVIDNDRKMALESIYLKSPNQPPNQPPNQLPIPFPTTRPQLTLNISNKNSDTSKYNYLDKYSLNKYFGEFQDLKKTYTIHFCLYRINNECDTPFVQYILAKNGYSYEFHKKTFLCPNIQYNNDGEEAQQCVILFNNFCIEYLIEILNVQDELTPYTTTSEYDGFIESSDNNIHVFFNCSSFKNIKLPQNTKSCLIDTILYSNDDETPISKQTKMFFEENPEIIHITDEYGKSISLPKELCICIEKDGEYLPEPEPEPEPNNNLIKIYSSPIKTELFGNVFIFSAPIKPSFFSIFGNNNTQKFCKCAVFVNNIKYLNGDSIENMDKRIIRDLLKSSENEKYSGICFKYRNNYYYSLKSAKKFTTITYS